MRVEKREYQRVKSKQDIGADTTSCIRAVPLRANREASDAQIRGKPEQMEILLPTPFYSLYTDLGLSAALSSPRVSQGVDWRCNEWHDFARLGRSGV